MKRFLSAVFLKWLHQTQIIIAVIIIACITNQSRVFGQCAATPGVLAGSGSFCDGAQIDIGIPLTKKSQTYTWYQNGTNIVKGPVTGNGSGISYEASMSRSTAGHYTVVTKKEGCDSTTFGDVNVAYVGAPTNVASTYIHFDSAQFNWDTIPGIFGYHYTVDTDSIPDSAGTFTTNAFASISNLTPFTNYYMHVQASGDNGGDCPWTSTKFNTGLANGPGSLDKSFNKNGKTTTIIGNAASANTEAFQSDGKIVVAGYISTNDDFDFLTMRYNTNGTLDKSFGKNGKATINFGSTDIITAIAVQPDDKIVAAGYTYVSGYSQIVLVRYKADGTIDKHFGNSGTIITDVNGQNSSPTSIVIQADGKIVVAGYTYNGSNSDIVLLRYRNNGELDTHFNATGEIIADFGDEEAPQCMALQPDGKIVLSCFVGSFPNTDFLTLRFNKNGTVDNKFGVDGRVYTDFGGSDYPSSIVILSNNKILVGGSSYIQPENNPVIAFVRYKPSGDYDLVFGESGMATYNDSDYVLNPTAMLVDKNNKILVGGYAQNGINYYDALLMRFSPLGKIDQNFGYKGKVFTDFGFSGDFMYAAQLQTDGKVVGTGVATDKIFLVRYNMDSTISAKANNYTNTRLQNSQQVKTSNILLSPNPVKDILHLNGMQSSTTKNIFITDVAGRTVAQFNTSSNLYSCNVSKLAPGMYFITVEENKKLAYLKFVKEQAILF
ncbi:MAG: T9SS type A sorting domain-containing protein [Parafilimonas sp.]|nr:T9SS type A sorting domain-containing protein [Parafilimonas sp.]